MIWFNIINFPKFRKEALNYTGTLDNIMRQMGYKSATFRTHGATSWGLSEEEFILFVLRWS